MNTFLKLQFTALLVISISFYSAAQFKWPNGAKVAVCLTYDDALDGHLDVAIPQLDATGLKGTFFCTGNSPTLYQRMNEWREAAKNGHELGNHTLFHPCLGTSYDGTKLDWVKPEYDLQNYNMAQIMNELRTASTLLKAIDGHEKRTYAYTCGNNTAGGVSFTDSLANLFTAARGGSILPQTMKGYDVYNTPSTIVIDNTAEELIASVNKAMEYGTIAIFMFHSVGGGYLNVGAEEHRKLLDYISKNRKDIYCATFMEVMEYVKKNNK
ncbi:MAG: hypothetical protein A2066_19305 [Bacteroidetes bacterium GWB2_41_8]|nr:MAG: hypothetical protein A2066_19305 [Bacteroidetes bacterium GWB2_41_8]